LCVVIVLQHHYDMFRTFVDASLKIKYFTEHGYLLMPRCVLKHYIILYRRVSVAPLHQLFMLGLQSAK